MKPEIFFNLLKERKVEFFTGIPDSLLKDFNAYILDNVSGEKHIITANEGNSIALAAGYYLATNKIPLVYMQNSGLGNALNPLISLADKEVYSIPMILLIGFRGEVGVKDEPQHTKQGRITTSLLETLEIPYSILSLVEGEGNIQKILDEAMTHLINTSTPYALIVKKDYFEKYSSKNNLEKSFDLSREEAIKLVVDNLDTSDIVVSTTGKISRELFEYRNEKGMGHENDFLTVGSMGHASSIAMGIALEKPNQNVYCFDGDGAFIMHMGSISTIGSHSLRNFKHVIFNNGAHDSVGGQPTAGFSIDIQKIVEGCGYKNVMRASNREELIENAQILRNSEGPSILEILISKGARKDLGRPTITPLKNKLAFMENLKN